MALGTRVVIGLLVLGLGMATLAWLMWERPQEYGNLRGQKVFPRFSDAGQCKRCHEKAWADWHGSAHRGTFGVPLTSEQPRPRLLPRPVLVTGVGKAPVQRRSRPGDGVDCLSCHLTGAGRVAARRDVPVAGCKPVRDDRLTSIDLCRSCHEMPPQESGDAHSLGGYALVRPRPVPSGRFHTHELERLGRAGGAEVFDTLVQVLVLGGDQPRKKASPEDELAAIRGLYWLRDPRAVPLLGRMLRGAESLEQRVWAAAAWLRTAPEDAEPRQYLLKLLDAGDYHPPTLRALLAR